MPSGSLLSCDVVPSASPLRAQIPGSLRQLEVRQRHLRPLFADTTQSQLQAGHRQHFLSRASAIAGPEAEVSVPDLNREQAVSTSSAQSQPEPADDDLVEIGIFLSPHGLTGAIRLQPTTDYPEERLRGRSTRWIQAQTKGRAAAPKTQIKVKSGKPSIYKGHDIWLMKVEGITNPEKASTLRNHRLYMLLSDCEEEVNDDEFYPWELVGMQARHHASGEAIGSIMDVFEGTGSHDLLKVRREDGQGTNLIPFVREIVPLVDRENRFVHIDPPVGLLDLISPLTPKKAKKQL